MFNGSSFYNEKDVEYTIHLNYFKSYGAPDPILVHDGKSMAVISPLDNWAGTTIMHTLDR